MRGYLGIMEEIAARLGRETTIKSPALLTSKCTFLPGTNGKHMSSDNAIYLSSSGEELARGVSAVESPGILRSWYEALNRNDLAKRVEGDRVSPQSLGDMTQFLTKELARFREFKVANVEIVEVLERSAVEARKRLHETLVEVKRVFRVPGFP